MISRFIRAIVVVALAVMAMPALAYAQLESPNYSLEEMMIGTGGDPELCSDSFCAQQSAGSLVGGNASSNGYGIQAGFGNSDEPTLVVAVTNNFVDLGVLNTSSPAAASANFSTSSYLSNGYVVRVHGNPPSNSSGGHTLDAMDGAGGSVPGVEQFGINLVANSTPGIGANPVQVPDSSFSYGAPTIAYGQEDVFKYEDGDIIAESTTETGQTNYTMSIIANVANSTPGGRYRTVLVVQAIAMF